jgi:hypothetical protein
MVHTGLTIHKGSLKRERKRYEEKRVYTNRIIGCHCDYCVAAVDIDACAEYG